MLRTGRLLGIGWLLLGCSSEHAGHVATTQNSTPTPPTAASAPTAAATGAPGIAAATTPLPPSVNDAPPPGTAYDAELALLWSWVACPPEVAGSAASLKTHCQELAQASTDFGVWLGKARAFFAQKVPAHQGGKVVYPFAGADLVSALTVYPQAAEITTLSLEPAGDISPVTALKDRALVSGLKQANDEIRLHVRYHHNLTVKMISTMRQGAFPVHIFMSLFAMRLHGLTPTTLRYFHVKEDGSLEYLTETSPTPTAAKAKPAVEASASARNQRFANAEIGFRNAAGATGVYRHIMANLDNAHLAAGPGVLRHLESKGKVWAMTKAASFLLWWEEFSTVRNYLVAHTDFMVSDATGILPQHAKAAGFEQEVWGVFGAPLLKTASGGGAAVMIKLWAQKSQGPLSFVFGYPDAQAQPHRMITRRISAHSPPSTP